MQMDGSTTEAEPETQTGEAQKQTKSDAAEKPQEQKQQSAEPRKPSALKNPRVRQRLLIAAAVILIAGFLVWFYYRNRESTDDAQVDGHIIPISSRVPGSVLEVLVNDNEAVRQGQLLVQLDPRDYQAKLDDAKATLAVAQSRVQSATVNVPLTSATTRSDTSGASASVAAAQSAYEQAQLALHQASTSQLAHAQANVQKQEAANQKAQSDLTRMKPLAEREEISQQQYDAYVAAATEAKGELDAALQDLDLAKQTIPVRQAQVAAAKADLERAQANLQAAQANQRQIRISAANEASARAAVEQAQADEEAAELNLSYTKIVAPEDGVVTNKTVQVGQILSPGEGLMVVVPLADIWVTANYKETQLAQVRPGDRAEVHVDMYGKSFPGRVDSIAGATGSRLSLLPPENATGNYVKVVERIPVKIILDPIPENVAILRPGMNVEATIITR
jgi:membrane fusion protein, multidrug efflux system